MNEKKNAAAKDLWERTRMIFLSTQNSPEEKSQVERYLSMISSVAQKDDVFTLYTSNAYASELLTNDYSEKIRQCMQWAGGSKDLKVEFVFDPTTEQPIVVPKEEEKTAPSVSASDAASGAAKSPSFISTMPLNPDYTFDEFVRGPSNSFAYAAAKGIVAEPSKKGYNPLFIHGGTGLGKTHLMQAIGNAILKDNPSANVCYLTAETFLNEYVNALSKHDVQEFRERYRKVDILLVDDVQFLNSKDNCQDEFFNTFNALHGAHKQIVMTCDMAPKDIPGVQHRLITRFEWGMVQEIEVPSYETRLAILRKKAENMTPPVNDEILQFIADKIKSHVRAMEGALSKVNIYLSTEPATQLTPEVLSYLLKDLIEKENNRKKITVDEVQVVASKKYGVTLAQMLSEGRTQSIVTPRQLAMYIARKFTTKSLQEIAEKFKRSHATILHGVKNIENHLQTEPELKATLQEILAELGLEMSDNVD